MGILVRHLPYFMFFLFQGGLVSGQNEFIYFDRLDVARGLQNNLIYDLYQDSRGYVWLASHGGLQKFDGNNFSAIQFPEALKGVHVYKVFIDSKNRVWLATSAGIVLHNQVNGTFSVISKGGIYQGRQLSFHEDLNGTIWISGGASSLYFYDSEEKAFVLFSKKWPTCKYTLQSFLSPVTPENYWFYDSAGVVRYQIVKNQFSAYDRKRLEIESKFGQSTKLEGFIKVNRNNSVGYKLVSDNSQMLVVHDVLADIRHVMPNFNGKSISKIHYTKDGRVLAVGSDAIYFFEEGKSRWLNLMKEERVLQEVKSVNCVMEDRDGLIWIGTENGVITIKSNDLKFIYDAEVKADYYKVLNVLDSLLMVVVQTGDKIKIELLNDQLSKTKRFNDFLSRVNSSNIAGLVFCKGQDEDVIMLTNNDEIIQLEFQKQRIQTYNIIGLKANHIVALAEGNDGEIWLLKDTGIISVWNKGKNHLDDKFKIPVSQTDEDVVKLSFDKELNCLWIAYPFAVTRANLADNSVVSYQSEARITAFKDWERDSVILGTKSGLRIFSKHHPENQIHFQTSIDLSEFHVASLEEDKYGNLWMAVKGIGMYKISYRSRFVLLYGNSNGIHDQTFYNGVSTSFPNGWMYFGTEFGILKFFPSDISYTLNPRVHITNFYVANEPLSWTFNNRSVPLSWSQNTVTIEFSSLTFLNRKSIHYAYKLEGYDDEWRLTQGETKVHYGNIPAGSYTFRVQAKTMLQNILSDEVSLPFTIEAPFWQRWYVRLVVALIFVMIISAFYYARAKRLRIVTQIKNAISRDLHDHIGSSLSSIGFMTELIKKETSKERIQSIIERISRSAQITQENLYDIIWQVNAGDDDFASIADRMREFIHNIFESQSVKTTFEIDKKVLQVEMNLDHQYELYLIFKELIINAAKHSAASVITVNLFLQDSRVCLDYSDNGVGFDINKRRKGYGLSNMEERVSALKGTLAIQSTPEVGTNIRLSFPCR
jgi:signal transduction histidine kinase/ligand-binding sensor domain-containing protein